MDLTIPHAIPNPLYFLHISKTAGITLALYLDTCFRPDRICPATSWEDGSWLGRPSSYDLYRGHFGAMLPTFLERELSTITVLRDPVARAVSEWRYVLRHADHPSHAEALRQGPDLTQWVLGRGPDLRCVPWRSTR